MDKERRSKYNPREAELEKARSIDFLKEATKAAIFDIEPEDSLGSEAELEKESILRPVNPYNDIDESFVFDNPIRIPPLEAKNRWKVRRNHRNNNG